MQRLSPATRCNPFRIILLIWLSILLFTVPSPCVAQWKVGTFQSDITIPLGHRCMGVLDTKSKTIDDPLEMLGVVLLGPDKPIVIVALDWCEVRNGAYDQWRDALASAAGTSRQRVLVCSLHQHDAPVTDSGAQKLLDDVGLPGELYHREFHTACIKEAASKLRSAINSAKPLTHLAMGQAEVEDIASNRRVEYADGSVRYDRYSSSGPNSPSGKRPRGQIDPMLKSLTLYSGDQAVVTISHYATHPMSYYGRGGVSADFVGLARRRRQVETPSTLQMYVTGCSGDVTAGKYNDGTPTSRAALTERLYQGMRAAAEDTARAKVESLGFRSAQFQLPFHDGPEFTMQSMRKVLEDPKVDVKKRILAAMGLSSRQRIAAGQPIDLPCIEINDVRVLLLPGESFVGYQIMAQDIGTSSFVMAIGFGECWPGYIPTKLAFDEGFGHSWRWVSAGCEAIIREALEKVLVQR